MTNNLPITSPADLAVIRAGANRVRAARAEVKANIANGNVSLASVFDLGGNGVGDKIAGRLRVSEAIRAKRGWGPKRATDLLSLLKIDPNTHIDKISKARLDSILAVVEPQ